MDDRTEHGWNRRAFLKNTGLAVGGLGLSSVLPGLVRDGWAANRDHILIGQPAALTGPLAAFGEPTSWVHERVLREINKDGGISIKGRGKKLPVKIKVLDTESNPTKAVELASKLVQGDRVDLMCVDHSPLTVDPVTTVCERFGVPCIAVNSPLDSFFQSAPHKWAFLSFWSVHDDILPVYTGMWEQVPTNRTVGLVFVNDPDAVGWSRAFNAVLPKKGYKVVDAGLFPPGHKDFGGFIDTWKKANVEILVGNMTPPDWITCWRQCRRQGFVPKVATIGRACLFPSAVEALGDDLPKGITTEVWWSPNHPYKSSLTGYGARELCDAYTRDSGKQWTQPIGYSYALYEIANDVLRRAGSLDRAALREAIAATNLATIVGPIRYNKENYCRTPVVGGQWVKGKKFPWDLKITYNGQHPEVPVAGKTVPLG